jgi:antitoxin MazE
LPGECGLPKHTTSCFPFRQKAEINDGTIVEVSFKDDAIIIIKKNRLSLEEMLNDITAENLHDELDTGSVVGREIW